MAVQENHSDDKLIKGTSKADIITNFGTNATIDGGKNNDFIINGGYWEDERGGSKVSLLGGSGNDTLTSHGNNSVLDGGTGDDLIYNGYRYYAPWDAFYDSDSDDFNGNHTTIFGGEGNDTIKNCGDFVTIDAGEGDDSIYSSGENVLVKVNGGQNTVEGTVTINTGTGNSTLTGDRNVQVYQYGGGNDLITNYSGEDIIHIASGKLDSYSFDGGDLIFHIGDGSIRLKNMTNHAITVKDSSSKTTTKIYNNGYSPQQVIKNFVKTTANSLLNSKIRLDEAIKACSGFNSVQEVIDKMLADCRTANNADTFLRDYCGIITDNEDTGAIVGWDAGGLIMKTHDDLMPETVEVAYPSSTTFTKHGLTLTVPEKNTLNEQEQLVVQGLYSWWMENSLNLIEESYGLSFTDKTYSIPFKFEYKPGDFGWAWGGSLVSVNMSYTHFEESDKTGGGLDGALVHEFTHVMQCNFNVWSYMTNYMTEGMANLTGGGDSYTNLAGNADSLAAYLDVDNTFSEDGNVYTVGYMFWRYLMKQASDSYDSLKNYAFKNGSSIVGTKNAELLTGSGKNQTISAGKGNDTITVYGKKMKIFGEDGDDYILIGSYASGASIDGGTGHDYIYSEGMKVTITGGAGNDSILNDRRSEYNWNTEKWEVVSSPDNVKITAGNGKDTIENHGVKASISAGAGDDSITNHAEGANSTLDGGTGNDKINNWAGEIWNEETQKYDIIPSPNNTKMFGGDGKDTLYNEGSIVLMDGGTSNDFLINGGYSGWERGGSKVSLLGGSGNDTLTSHGSKSLLDGGKGNDLIYNGYRYYEPWNAFYDSDSNDYNGNNTTIIGGTGNDTIKNLGEKVLFVYSDNSGNDFIEGFNETSKLSIASGTYASIKTGNDVIVNVGKGNITLNGASILPKINIKGKKSSILTATNSTPSFVKVDSSVKTVDAKTRTKAINITGNKLANTIIGDSKSDSLYGEAGADSILGNAGNDKIYGGKGNDSLFGGDGKDTLSGESGNDKLFGGKGNDSLSGGGSNDTLIGDAGNDTLTGGAGNDVFVYSAGKDIISDYAAGDKISLSAASKSSTVSGSNIVFTIDKKNSLTVQKAKGKTLSLIDSKGKEYSTVLGGTTLTLTNDKESVVKVNSSIKVIDGSKRKTEVEITGNALANTISGGSGNDMIYGGKGNDKLYGNAGNDKLYGGKGNDSLWGGKGNDKLWGDAGADKFIYTQGDGKDIIYGFDDKDTLTLDNLNFKASYNKKNKSIALTFDDGSITLKNFTATTFHINNDTYKISGSKFKKQ